MCQCKRRAAVFSCILALPVREPCLAVISAHQKTAGAAGGIQHNVAGAVNAERIDDIHNVFIGEILAELIPFFRSDQLLEDAADDALLKVSCIRAG